MDITTLQSLLDNPSESALAWRHRSFCEYFGGLRLAELPRGEQEDVARQHARDPNWNWVFRFALSRLASSGSHLGPDALARDLIRYGNPFLVYEAIDRDRIPLEDSLDGLCRWLVHRDYSPDRDYRGVWDANRQRPAVTADVLSILDPLLDRSYRDSRCLHPAWELLESSGDGLAAAIRERFLSEFQSMLDDPAHPDHPTASALALQGFVRCPQNPADDRKPFLMGSPEGVGDGDERPQHEVMVSPFTMLATPVTNRQFELFDPSHRSQRDRYSLDEDCPVIYVSWYMAAMFCRWLGPEYRLPTEAE